MIMKILYKADDGTIFNDAVSCRHYEINSELDSSYGGKSITCYDKHNNIIKNPDFLSTELSGMKKVYNISLKLPI